MNCNTTHYRANSSSVPGDPTPRAVWDGARVGAVLDVERTYRADGRATVYGSIREVWLRARRVEGVDSVRMSVRGARADAFSPGSVWRVSGTVSAPRDWRARGAWFRPGADGLLLLRAGGGDGAAAAFRKRASRCLSRGIEGTQSEGLLKALVLGVRRRRDRDVFDVFRRSGTFHVFAVSGLHVGIVCALVVFSLRLAGVPVRWWVLLLVPVMLGYSAVTGWRASAVRATLMAGAYYAAGACSRQPNSRSALGLAVFAIVLWDYRRVYDVGFVFSATVVWVLIDWYPVVLRLLSGRSSELRGLDPAPFRRVVRRLRELIALSVSAWLGAVGLTAYFFGQVSLVGMAANILAVPVAFCVVLSGCLSLLLGSCLPALAVVYNNAAHGLIQGLVAFCEAVATLPGAGLSVPRPPAATVVLYYIVLATVRHVALPSDFGFGLYAGSHAKDESDEDTFEDSDL